MGSTMTSVLWENVRWQFGWLDDETFVVQSPTDEAGEFLDVRFPNATTVGFWAGQPVRFLDRGEDGSAVYRPVQP